MTGHALGPLLSALPPNVAVTVKIYMEVDKDTS